MWFERVTPWVAARPHRLQVVEEEVPAYWLIGTPGVLGIARRSEGQKQPAHCISCGATITVFRNGTKKSLVERGKRRCTY